MAQVTYWGFEGDNILATDQVSHWISKWSMFYCNSNYFWDCLEMGLEPFWLSLSSVLPFESSLITSLNWLYYFRLDWLVLTR